MIVWLQSLPPYKHTFLYVRIYTQTFTSDSLPGFFNIWFQLPDLPLRKKEVGGGEKEKNIWDSIWNNI